MQSCTRLDINLTCQKNEDIVKVVIISLCRKSNYICARRIIFFGFQTSLSNFIAFFFSFMILFCYFVILLKKLSIPCQRFYNPSISYMFS